MFEHLSSRRLLIISDSAMYENQGACYAYEPVWREVEAMASIFSEIVWMGALSGQRSPDFSLVHHPKVRTYILPRMDYPRGNAFHVLGSVPKMIREIRARTKEADLVHSRGPSHPAALSLLLSTWGHRPSWHKYAGDWLDPSGPRSYAFQRKLLRNRGGERVKVSVNARHSTDPDFIVELPNPCLWRKEWEEGQSIMDNRNYQGPYSWVFAGNLTESKGVRLILDALEQPGALEGLASLTIVGRGPLEPEIRQRIALYRGPVKVKMTGPLNRKDLNQAFMEADFLILPSRSEGFPKVVAEAASFGCIPITPSFPSMRSWWRDGETGFMWRPGESLREIWHRARHHRDLLGTGKRARQVSAFYTYETYLERIAQDLFPANA